VDPGPFFYIYYFVLQALFTFRKHYFILLQTNIIFHMIRLILCYQQTGEIDNLTVSWGKVFWLCCDVAAGADTTPSKTPSGAVAKVS
jgi:hypothetical protein